MSYQPTKWSELVYIQRQPEDKDQFARNWELAFGKKEKKNEKEKEASVAQEEILNAHNENNT